MSDIVAPNVLYKINGCEHDKCTLVGFLNSDKDGDTVGDDDGSNDVPSLGFELGRKDGRYDGVPDDEVKATHNLIMIGVISNLNLYPTDR